MRLPRPSRRRCYKVLKQIHPETGISKRGMSIMNSFLERVCTEAGKLARYNKKKMLSSREVLSELSSTFDEQRGGL